LEPALSEIVAESTRSRSRLADVLGEAAVQQRHSAMLLQRHGFDEAAVAAKRAAVRTELMLTDPIAIRRMLRFSREALRAADGLIERALEGAIGLLGADFGNVQIPDPRSGALLLTACDGFNAEFREVYSVVQDEGLACGRAAARREQMVIDDVNSDPGFTAHRGNAAAAGFRAVVSTPVVDSDGRLRAVISTHFRRRHRPSGRELEIVAWYADRIGAAFASSR
jgi:GAF domain-containing protein